MLRHVKPLLALVLVMVVVQRDSAFTLWGPLETWQTAALSYGARYWYSLPITTMTNLLPPRLPGNVGYTELGGP